MKGYLYRRGIVFILFLLGIQLYTNGHKTQNRMNFNKNPSYVEKFKRVKINSTVDNHIQPAIFYKSGCRTKKPLIVYLHSWSGDYTQGAELAKELAELDWNYISPNFRGPNNKPEACGSPLVISDIEDAIDYALKNANADKNQIHIIGGSGGGYATLLCYMKLKRKINSFSAWSSITNIVDWYYESIGRQNKYSDDIFKATSSITTLNFEEAKRRSPIYMNYPRKIRNGAKLYLYHGIQDGYLGPVPITHSINFYNELLTQINPLEKQNLISKQDIMDLLIKRCYPGSISSNEMIGDRKIHYKRNYENTQIIIFEGKHEMLGNDVILNLIPVKSEE